MWTGKAVFSLLALSRRRQQERQVEPSPARSLAAQSGLPGCQSGPYTQRTGRGCVSSSQLVGDTPLEMPRALRPHVHLCRQKCMYTDAVTDGKQGHFRMLPGHSHQKGPAGFFKN